MIKFHVEQRFKWLAVNFVRIYALSNVIKIDTKIDIFGKSCINLQRQLSQHFEFDICKILEIHFGVPRFIVYTMR